MDSRRRRLDCGIAWEKEEPPSTGCRASGVAANTGTPFRGAYLGRFVSAATLRSLLHPVGRRQVGQSSLGNQTGWASRTGPLIPYQASIGSTP
jgi:hypothetical protein